MLAEYMANPNGFSNTQAARCRGQASLPPKVPSPAPNCGSVHTNKQVNMPRPYSTDVLLTEEPPSWFEDLLNEPESPANKGHRRSASDPFAYLAVNNSENGSWLRNMLGGPNWNFQMPQYANGMPQASANRMPNPRRQQQGRSCSPSPPLPYRRTAAEEDAELQALGMSCSTPDTERATLAGTETQNQVDTTTSDNSAGGSDCSQLNPPDVKRKQQNARRSRVRKLQYIAELERNAQVLQMEGAEVSAQLEFLDQQNLILAMENRALKQRLENLSQEHFIKSLEQELLDKELARLQHMQHLQNMTQHQQRQRQKQAAAHRRGRSCDLESQFARLRLHPPEATPTSNGFKEPQRN